MIRRWMKLSVVRSVRRFSLALAVGAVLSAGPGLPSWAGPGEEGQRREAVVDSQRLRFDAPEGFCRVSPQRGGNHAKLWQNFTPPPQRNAVLLALELDCETLHAVEAGPLRRPRHLFNLLGTRPDPRLPSSLEDALIALEKRFSRPELATRAPVLGRDAYAVYVQQGQPGKGGLTGVSAFTIRRGQPMILNFIDFHGLTPVPEMRSRLADSMRSLHELSP